MRSALSNGTERFLESSGQDQSSMTPAVHLKQLSRWGAAESDLVWGMAETAWPIFTPRTSHRLSSNGYYTAAATQYTTLLRTCVGGNVIGVGVGRRQKEYGCSLCSFDPGLYVLLHSEPLS